MTSSLSIRPASTKLSLAALLLFACAATAHASPISYDFSGIITGSSASTYVSYGTPFSGTFTYDTTFWTPGIGYEGNINFEFGFNGALPDDPQTNTAGLTIQIGDQTKISNDNGLSIGLIFPPGGAYAYTVGSQIYIATLPVGYSPPAVTLVFNNPTTNVLTGNGYPDPLLQINLSNFPIATIAVDDSNGNLLYSGVIESLTEATVPEPAHATLLAFAAIAWFARSRKSRVQPTSRQS
jgi:hypothetical protein